VASFQLEGFIMDFGHSVLLFALFIQVYNLGTIWFAQLVVYPLFGKVGPSEYIPYHRDYASRIPLPVILPGFLSFFLPVAVFAWLPDSVPDWMALANICMGLIGLAVTLGLAIPRHNRLERGGKNDKLIAELIAYNWPRTASITASAALTIAMAARAFVPV
jgi:hypothetical protein